MQGRPDPVCFSRSAKQQCFSAFEGQTEARAGVADHKKQKNICFIIFVKHKMIPRFSLIGQNLFIKSRAWTIHIHPLLGSRIILQASDFSGFLSSNPATRSLFFGPEDPLNGIAACWHTVSARLEETNETRQWEHSWPEIWESHMTLVSWGLTIRLKHMWGLGTPVEFGQIPKSHVLRDVGPPQRLRLQYVSVSYPIILHESTEHSADLAWPGNSQVMAGCLFLTSRAFPCDT